MAYFFTEEDISDLKKEIPAQTALKYTCPQIRKNSILCPNPEHNDMHYGNCMLLKNGRIHCFACGKEFTALDLLKLDGYSLYDAACILAEESGHPQDYEASSKKRETQSKNRLSFEEKTLLGLSSDPNIRMILGVNMDRPEDQHYMKKSRYYEKDGLLETETEYLILGKTKNPWRDLMSDREAFSWMVQCKCQELMVRCISGAAQTNDDELKNVYQDVYKKAEDIFVRHGGTLTSTKNLYQSVKGLYQALQ